MANSYKDLKYIVTFESLSNDEAAIAAFASWADAVDFLNHKAVEEKQLNGCFRVDYDEGIVTCWLDPSQPDDRDVYRIRKPL